MSEEKNIKLNLPEETAYYEMPYAFLGKKNKKSGEPSPFEGLTTFDRQFLALIHTANKLNKCPAKLTYDLIAVKLHTSKETISARKKVLIEKGILEEVKQSRYKILIPYNNKFFKIDAFLLTQEFEMLPDEKEKKRPRKQFKRLTRNSVLAVSLIKDKNLDTGEFVSSQARIGVALNIPRTTAGDSVREIFASTLCFGEVPTDEKKASRGLTSYKVAPEFLELKRIKAKKDLLNQVKNIFGQTPDTVPQPEVKYQNNEGPNRDKVILIEQHYDELRHRAQSHADKVLAKAMADEAYASIHKRLNNLAIEIAFAEIKNPAEAEKLTREQRELEAQGLARLNILGINKEDFEPKYKCLSCNDTGYLPNGKPCRCQIKLIKELKI